MVEHAALGCSFLRESLSASLLLVVRSRRPFPAVSPSALYAFTVRVWKRLHGDAVPYLLLCISCPFLRVVLLSWVAGSLCIAARRQRGLLLCHGRPSTSGGSSQPSNLAYGVCARIDCVFRRQSGTSVGLLSPFVCREGRQREEERGRGGKVH